MRVLIIGCGYVGTPLGKRLVEEGHQVFGLRRSAEEVMDFKLCGIQPIVADITRADALAKVPGPFDWVVNVVSSSGRGTPEYRSVYLEGTRNLLHWLQAAPPKKFAYTSSTSVYAQNDGSGVKETSPTEPAHEAGKILLATEKLLLDAAEKQKFPAVLLRVAGIYGPDRTHLLQRFLRNEVKMPGHGDRYLNMIHRDDLVSAIIAALKNGRTGEIYNAVDDEPVTELHFYRWLAEAMGKWLPPFTDEPMDDHKRARTNKRVQNRRLKMELGLQFKFPTFRQGYTAELTRLERAGALDIQPEPR